MWRYNSSNLDVAFTRSSINKCCYSYVTFAVCWHVCWFECEMYSSLYRPTSTVCTYYVSRVTMSHTRLPHTSIKKTHPTRARLNWNLISRQDLSSYIVKFLLCSGIKLILTVVFIIIHQWQLKAFYVPLKRVKMPSWCLGAIRRRVIDIKYAVLPLLQLYIHSFRTLTCNLNSIQFYVFIVVISLRRSWRSFFILIKRLRNNIDSSF